MEKNPGMLKSAVRRLLASAALAALTVRPEWAEWRDELTSWPGTEDRVARFGRAFDSFAGETFARAYAEIADPPAR